MRLHNASCDGQSHAQPWLQSSTEEFIKYLRAQFWRNARAFIINSEADIIFSLLHRDGDLGGGARIFGCVLQQSENYLRDQTWIDLGRRQATGNGDLHRVSVKQRAGAEKSVLYHFFRRNVSAGQRDLACLEFGQVHHALNEM